jgi:hypothetical protein
LLRKFETGTVCGTGKLLINATESVVEGSGVLDENDVLVSVQTDVEAVVVFSWVSVCGVSRTTGHALQRERGDVAQEFVDVATEKDAVVSLMKPQIGDLVDIIIEVQMSARLLGDVVTNDIVVSGEELIEIPHILHLVLVGEGPGPEHVLEVIELLGEEVSARLQLFPGLSAGAACHNGENHKQEKLHHVLL